MKGNQAQGEQDSTEPKDNKRKVRTKREKRTPVNRREYGSGGVEGWKSGGAEEWRMGWDKRKMKWCMRLRVMGPHF